MAQVTFEVPDELATALSGQASDLPRAVFEAAAVEAYRERRITTAQLRRILGFEDRYALDGFLKERQVWLDYTVEDFERESDLLRKLRQ
jgi:predicted HTH domain antitoxin